MPIKQFDDSLYFANVVQSDSTSFSGAVFFTSSRRFTSTIFVLCKFRLKTKHTADTREKKPQRRSALRSLCFCCCCFFFGFLHVWYVQSHAFQRPVFLLLLLLFIVGLTFSGCVDESEREWLVVNYVLSTCGIVLCTWLRQGIEEKKPVKMKHTAYK